jgi:hypothetical protein
MAQRSRSVTGKRAREAGAAAARLLADDPRVELVYLMRLRADVVAAIGVPLDLIALNHAPVVLMHEVVEHGRCLFARNPETETDFVVRARARYWDFKPFLETQWRYAGERLQERQRGA